MPKIPVATRQVRSAPLGGSGIDPSASAAALGGNLGAGLDDLGEGVRNYQLRAKAEANQIWSTEYSTKGGDITSQLETKVQGMRGKNAIGDATQKQDGAIDVAKKEFDAAFTELDKSISNDQQRQFAKQFRDQKWAALNNQVQRHVAREREVHDDQATQAYVDLQVEDAAKVANGWSPEGYALTEQKVANAISATMQQADRKGWSDVKTKETIAERTSNIRGVTAANLIDNGTYADAKAYYDKVAPSLDLATRRTLDHALKTKDQKIQSIDIADRIFNESDNGATINDLYQAVANDEQVKKNPQIREQIEARLALRQRALAQSYNEESARLYNTSYAIANEQGFDAIPVTDLARLAAIDPQRHAALVNMEIKKAKGIPIQTDMTRWLQLNTLAANPELRDPVSGKTFIEMNVADEFPVLDETKQGQLVSLYADAVKSANKPESSTRLTEIRNVNDVTERVLAGEIKSVTNRMKNTDAQNALLNQFQDALYKRVTRWQQANKKEMTREQIQKEADDLMIEKAVKPERSIMRAILKYTVGSPVPITLPTGMQRQMENVVYMNQVASSREIPREEYNEVIRSLRKKEPQLFIPVTTIEGESVRAQMLEQKILSRYNGFIQKQGQASLETAP